MTQKKSPSKASRSRKRGRPRKSLAAKRLACKERGMFLANKVTGRCRKTSRARKSSSSKSSSRKGSSKSSSRKGSSKSSSRKGSSKSKMD